MDTYYILKNNKVIPVIGFGTWQIPDGEICHQAVTAALKAGYRHIDTAMAYRNEASVGKAIREAKIPREELFITTKLPADIKGYQETMDAFTQSLYNLEMNYLDLYLIHNVKPWGKEGDGMEYMDQNIASWKAMEKLYREGKIKAIGVSNFLPQHLEILQNNTEIPVMVNQIQVNPNVIPTENIRYCKDQGILIEAYSPLGTGRVLKDSRFEKIADRYQKSAAQLCIRWSYQNGFLPLPKSVTEERIRENLNIFDFTISEPDMNEIGKAD